MKQKLLLEKFAIKFRHKLCNYFPDIAIWIYSKHRGECKDCNDCCELHENYFCPHIKNNLCSIYQERPLFCKTAPLPFDLWWGNKYRNCHIYYPFLIKAK